MAIGDLIREAANGQHGPDQKRIADEGLKWIETLLKKNLDYGSSAWKVPILAPECDAGTAIRVRMSDKIERLRNLLSSKQPAQVTAESIVETMMDLGCYSLLLLAKPEEVEADVRARSCDIDESAIRRSIREKTEKIQKWNARLRNSEVGPGPERSGVLCMDPYSDKQRPEKAAYKVWFNLDGVEGFAMFFDVMDAFEFIARTAREKTFVRCERV